MECWRLVNVQEREIFLYFTCLLFEGVRDLWVGRVL